MVFFSQTIPVQEQLVSVGNHLPNTRILPSIICTKTCNNVVG